MSENLILPALGESITEGTVTRWLKNVGDSVEVDEPILEVSTDKVDTEIPSPIAGVLEQILVQEDEVAEVGSVLGVIGSGNKVASADEAPQVESPVASMMTEPAATAPFVSAVDTFASSVISELRSSNVLTSNEPLTVDSETSLNETSEPVLSIPIISASTANLNNTTSEPEVNSQYVTPIVRKMAADYGVNLNSISGTGIGGRIRKEDILNSSINSNSAPADNVLHTTNGSTQPESILTKSTSTPYVKLEVSSKRGTTEQFSRLRKVIAERAVASLQTTAQLTSVVEVDVTKLSNYRNSTKDSFFEATGTKLSFMPFFALAACEALKTYPIINSSVNGDTIVYPAAENLSIAVDTDRGLLTPVIRDASEKSIATLAKETADLATRTRENQLKPDELARGTFTLTNTGSRGALFDTPLVFSPQSAILGTGVVVEKPGVVKDSEGNSALAIRSYVYLALSYDHRIIDGADAARYLTAVKARLQECNFESNIGI